MVEQIELERKLLGRALLNTARQATDYYFLTEEEQDPFAHGVDLEQSMKYLRSAVQAVDKFLKEQT